MDSLEILKRYTNRFGNINVGDRLPEILHYLEGAVYSNACKKRGIPYVCAFHGFRFRGRRGKYCSPVLRGIVVVKADLDLIWQEVGAKILKKTLKNHVPPYLSAKSVDGNNLLPISLRIPYAIATEQDMWLRSKLIEAFVEKFLIKGGYRALSEEFASNAVAATDILCLAADYVILEVEYLAA